MQREISYSSTRPSKKYSSRDTVPFIGGGAGVLLPAGRLRLAAGLLLGVGHTSRQGQADQGRAGKKTAPSVSQIKLKKGNTHRLKSTDFLPKARTKTSVSFQVIYADFKNKLSFIIP
jgi:hypothetical protein